MSKKLLSVILSFLIVLSVFSAMPVLAEDNETEILGPGVGENTLPEIAEGCNRYFFYMPKSWENEYTQTAGIYWFEGTGAHDSWPGVEANKADAEGLYYYDVPKDVTSVIWNNYFDGGMDFDSPEYKAAQLSGGICTEYYEAGESPLYPDGLESFNNMVWVVDYNDCYCMEFDVPGVCGDWYYYYGNGEYGTTPEKGDVFYTERSLGGEYCRHNRPTYSEILPELSSDYNRYFFYMPDYWQFENRFELKVQYDNSGITYLEYADAEGVFFCDLPKETKAFYIVYGDEKVKSASPAPVVPDFSLQECCGKILVIDMDWLITDMSTGNNIYSGFWFYYYGNGEYGDVPVRGDGDTYTDSVINPILPPEKLFLCGDADQNGVINVKDATAIQKHIADIQPCDEVAGNVDFMSGLTIKDATAIQKYLAGIDTGFLIGQYVS